MTISKQRIWLIAGVFAFVGLFYWVYVTWLHPTFGYIGFHYVAPGIGDQVLALLLSVLPALWMPMNLQRPSQLICWILYLVVLIPSMFVPLFAGLHAVENVRMLMLVLFAGFSIVCTAQRLPPLKLPALRIPLPVFWAGYWIIFAGLVLWVVAVYRGHFQLVGLGAVYESLRFTGKDVAQGTGVGYAVMWLSGSFVPFLMSWGLVRKRVLPLLVGVAVLVLLYSTAGLKSILTSAVLTPALYFTMRGDRIPFATKVIWALVVLFTALNLANLAVGELSHSHLLLSAIVFARTFGGPGLLTAMYHDFFSDNPLTYYSHVKGINLFVAYPYQSGIGYEVGYTYSGRLELNSNAHLWCSDGLAALGFPGVLLISLLCAVVFWLLDSAATGHAPAFSITSVNFAALNLSNASLFTTLHSGGLLFSILLLYLIPRKVTESEAPLLPVSLTTNALEPPPEPAMRLKSC